MKRNELFNDSPPKSHAFSIRAAVRDNLGNPIPGKFKEFSTDSAIKLSSFYLRCNPPRKNKVKKSELPDGVTAEAILNEINKANENKTE